MLLYPPLNEVEGGHFGFTLSVRPSISALFSMFFSALWLGCWELGMRKYSPRYGWNTDIMRRFLCIPVQILPSAFSPHFLSIFFHIRMRRFLRVSVRILPSTFPPHFFPHFFPYKNAEISLHSCPNTPLQWKCGNLGYGYNQKWHGN